MASLCQREIHVPSAALLPLPDQCRCDAHSDKKSGAMVNNLHGERAGLFLSCRETFCSVEAHIEVADLEKRACLRHVQAGAANGKTLQQACKEPEVVEQTYYRWRKEYGGLQVDQARRLVLPIKSFRLPNSPRVKGSRSSS